MKIIAVVLVSVFLVGCAIPCTYNGKPVPKQDAERMKELGMEDGLVCP